ncbi:MAG: transposase [Ruminococcus sp.]|nr:transposase [Ruminococcus sp.]
MNLPKRKSPRLKAYDYSTPGYYFVTICTHNKQKMFGEVVTQKACNPTVGAIHESPEKEFCITSEVFYRLPDINYTKTGRIVDDIINHLPKRFGVTIDKYIIMPNHIHMIMIIEDNSCSRAIRESPLRSRDIIEMVVGYIKMNASKKIHKEISKGKIWQRSFHDHIIRGEKDYQKIWQYIDSNPARWKDDCLYIE